MRKRFSVLLLCSVAFVSLLFVPTLIAKHDDQGPAIFAYGKWTYTPIEKDTREIDGGDYLFVLGSEQGIWTGTFTGTSYDAYVAMAHSGVSHLYYGLIEFESVVVDGREGSLIISFGPGEKVEGQWSGEWEVVSGTGELENLHGKGTWWGPSKNLDYEGHLHFDQRP